ncbi:MAG: helix-turn-helix transcriptional regulator [Acidobacteriaceae bacterium]|nr:helix-turn-helix transcriptional regulator [Acidobacteriaceae bacterium]
MARILGISQPQIHNVLKGARRLRPELADRLIANLEITVLDLLAAAELHTELLLRPSEPDDAEQPHSPLGAHLRPKRLGSNTRRKPSAREARSPGRAEQAG